MSPPRNVGGSGSRGRSAGASGRGRSGGRGRGGRGRGRGGRSSGRGTALPSALTGRGGGGGRGEGRRRKGSGGGGSSSGGYDFEDGAGVASDRHKYDDEAGDSDEGPDPNDSDFEDEEVDEDAAFDSADEARYGGLMETILQRRNGNTGSGSDEEGDRDEFDDDDDEGGAGAVSLMDMLDANEAADAQQKNAVDAQAKGRQGNGKSAATKGTKSGTAPASEDDDMDQDDSEGFSENFSDISDEDDDGEDEEERHARLMGFVGSLEDQAAVAGRAAEDRRSAQLLKEGEFNPTAVATGGGDGGAQKGSGVTMETLMGSLQNTKGFGAMKKQVAAFSGKSGMPSAPVHKSAELRAEREAAYDSRKSDMGKWVAPVQANRKAETLDFTPTVKTNLSNASLASKLSAMTDMEKEVEMLLTAGGASEAGLAEKEMEELKSKAYTVEEVRERQSELSKMRALMFYQERKQHHMNKIKSKVYRKIKKRQRDRTGEAELEASGEAGEVAARKRAEERMSLRHKNTTKWVKNALRAKGGAGKDDRKAIAEQLRLGQELREKMESVDNDDSSEDDASSEDELDTSSGNSKARRRKKSALNDEDRQELEGMGDVQDDGTDGLTVGGKGAALLKMAFMQKAMDKQRARAKEEASVLLRELEEASAAAAEENSEDDTRMKHGSLHNGKKNQRASSWGEDGLVGEGSNGPDPTVTKEARDAAAADMARTLPAGTLQASSVSMDARVRSSVASPITIDLGSSNGTGGKAASSSSSSPPVGVGVGAGSDGAETRSLNKPGDGAKATEMAVEASRTKRRREEEAIAAAADVMSDDAEEEATGDNPWLAPTPRRSKDRRRASTGEVLLDVRKAAATALAAFDVTPPLASDADARTADNKTLLEEEERNKRKKEKNKRKRESRKKNAISVNGKQGEQAVENAEGGPVAEANQNGSRKKRKRDGESDDENVGDGASNGVGNADDESGKKASEAEENRKIKAKNRKLAAKARKENQKQAGQDGQASSQKQAKAGGKKKRKAGAATDAKNPDPSAVKSVALAGLSNDELVRRAFAAPDFESEFKDSKDAEVDATVSRGREKLPGNLVGWGSWAGEGAPVARGPNRRQVLARKIQAEKEETLKKARKDDRLPTVMINEKRQKRSAKYMVSEVPYPFTSREQYERSLRQPIGGEWNTSQSVRDMTRPAVLVKAGAVVAPMKLGKLHRDNAKDKEAKASAKAAPKRGSKG